MSVNVEEIPLVTKKSSRSGNLFPSVGKYVGVHLIEMNSFSLGLPLINICLLLLLNVSLIIIFCCCNPIRL